MRLAVVVVNYRTPDLAIACVRSIVNSRAQFADLKMVVVDGGSGDGSSDAIAREIASNNLQEIVEFVPLPINGGFAYANNRALMMLAEEGDLPDQIALINPDARVTPGALEAMSARLALSPAAGAVGALLIHEDGRPQGSAFQFPSIRGEFCRAARTGVIDLVLRHPPSSIETSQAREVPWVTGAAVMFRTAALKSVGLFDEGFFLYFEETELMWRLRRAGWEIWHEPAARVVHAGGAATQIRDPETGLNFAKRMPKYLYESRQRYFALVGGRIYALLASLAWLLGNCIWQARRMVTGRSEDGPLREASDLIAVGLIPSSRAATAAVPRFGSSPEKDPAWMESRA
jgi:N-acetylglucosaminyl-diphospho-decaprenol L-rhamnosyltransferase